MSMNVFLYATVKATAHTSYGNKEMVITNAFDCWQTPTAITKSILKSTNPSESYKAWVRSVSENKELPIYADDDIFGEKEPVGIETYNEGEEHIFELEKWLEEYYGWNIHWEEI